MLNFIEGHESAILGIHSCFDRLILQGTFPDICYPDAMTRFFNRNRIQIFDFHEWAKPYRDQIRDHAMKIAAAFSIEIEFIRKVDSFRKEERIKEIVQNRGEQPGLVHIFSAMEACLTYKPWHDKKTHQTFFKYASGRCIHYYFYFIDEEFGLCYLRVPTWAPFRLQFYCNGHNWVANRLRKDNIGFTQLENTFLHIDNFDAAQQITDAFDIRRLHHFLDGICQEYCPVVHNFNAGIHWSIIQVEYATDIVFKDRQALDPIYEELVRTLCHAVKPDQLSMSLGKRLSPRFEAKLGSDFSTRIEGHCLRHHMNNCGIKMYDKFGRILRIETFCNNVSFFRHHRKVEHRNGTSSYKMASVRKTIYSLKPLAQILYACNRRYIEFLSSVDDPTNAIEKLNKVSRAVYRGGRSYRGFNLFREEDEIVFRTIAQGAAQAMGFRNADLRKKLHKSASQVSRILKRLRNHGLIKKAARSYKYHLTALGKQIVATSLKLKEMFLIPTLRGQLNLS